MRIYVGADYRGAELKQALLQFLANYDAEVIEPDAEFLAQIGVEESAYDSSATGVESELSACVSSGENSPIYDYNGPAVAVARAVREDDPSARGILICDSAHGMTMQANRFKGIRAANCDTAESAQLAREHDDANVICLSAHFTSAAELPEIVQAFLQTDFIPIERRVRRINRLDERSDYD